LDVWKELKDFLADRLKMDWIEFNREFVAGLSTKERLEEMLNQSTFAFLVMTAEDERTDGTVHAREKVIHEAGIFQGRLGFKRAIILLEDGCAPFSNIDGLTYLRFQKGNIKTASEDIRRVLEREGLIPEA
jgi:predicted nucleotide-binding protein